MTSANCREFSQDDQLLRKQWQSSPNAQFEQTRFKRSNRYNQEIDEVAKQEGE